MTLNSIPRELFLEIASETNIDDLDGVADRIAGISLAKLNDERRDPNKYFRSLVTDTQRLLRSMRNTNTILSGSRAAGYFYPSACTTESDWGFYCQGHPLHVVQFVSDLTEMGVTWKPGRNTIVGPVGTDFGYDHIIDNVLNGSIGSTNVQVIWFDNAGMSPIHHVMQFHSTIVQCFLTGYCAVSMYHSLSRRSLMHVWGKEHSTPTKECIEKYRARGFTPIELSWDEDKKPRCVSDEESLVVDLTRYLNDSHDDRQVSVESEMKCIMEMKWAPSTPNSRTPLPHTSTSLSIKAGPVRDYTYNEVWTVRRVGVRRESPGVDEYGRVYISVEGMPIGSVQFAIRYENDSVVNADWVSSHKHIWSTCKSDYTN